MHTSQFSRLSRCIGIAACLIGSVGLISQAPAADTNAKQNLSEADRTFVKEAAIGGLYEVQAGQLAAQKGSSAEVKQMAQHIVDDHTKANQQLKSLAQGKGMQELPMQLDAKHQSKLDALSKLSGADFDRMYTKMMVSDHKEDIKKFQKEADSGSDPDLKQFAASTLPALKQHLAMAESGTHAANRNGKDAADQSSESSKKSSTQQ